MLMFQFNCAELYDDRFRQNTLNVVNLRYVHLIGRKYINCRKREPFGEVFAGPPFSKVFASPPGQVSLRTCFPKITKTKVIKRKESSKNIYKHSV